MTAPSKVLLWNRPNARSAPGGDTVQWDNTAAELRALGLDVDTSLELEPDLEPYDVVHLFNLQRYDAALPVAERAKALGKKIALSTIWWDMTECNYVQKVQRSLKRRMGRTVMGRTRHLARFRARYLSKPKSRAIREQCARLVEISDILLPNSQAETRVLEEYLQVSGLEAKTAVIPNATSFDPSDPATTPSEGRVGILQVGKFHLVKNQASLLRALQGLDVKVTLVGDMSEDDYVAECREAAEALDVAFVGPLPHSSLPDYYRRAAIHVLPSFRETPGLVSLEAAKLGCTVVSTDRGSAVEYFGAHAYYCDPARLGSIRSAVEQALAEPRLVPRSRLARFSWRNAGLATRQAYRWLFDSETVIPGSLEIDCASFGQ